MSIATQIQRLYGLRNRIKTKLKNLGILRENIQQRDSLELYESPGDDWVVVGNNIEACAETILKIDGTKQISTLNEVNVTRNKYAVVSDDNLRPENIKNNVTILGITGTAGSGTLNTTSTTIYTEGEPIPHIPNLNEYPTAISTNGQELIYPDGYDSFGTVSVTNDSPKTCIPQNIRNGITIHGQTGIYNRNLQRAYGTNLEFGNSLIYSDDDKYTYRTIRFNLKKPNGTSVNITDLPSVDDIEYLYIYFCDNDYSPGTRTICRFISSMRYSKINKIVLSRGYTARFLFIYSKNGNVNATYILNDHQDGVEISLLQDLYGFLKLLCTVPLLNSGWMPGFVNDANYCLELIW